MNNVLLTIGVTILVWLVISTTVIWSFNQLFALEILYTPLNYIAITALGFIWLSMNSND